MSEPFFGTEKPINLQDLSSVEADIGRILPEEFRNHYLNNNGGVPPRSVFPGNSDWESIRITRFFPIKYNADENNTRTTLLEGIYHLMVQKEVIPATLLPFANDQGGNFICLDLNTGAVFFYATDAFDPDISPKENQALAQRKLAVSFSNFMQTLVETDENG